MRCKSLWIKASAKCINVNILSFCSTKCLYNLMFIRFSNKENKEKWTHNKCWWMCVCIIARKGGRRRELSPQFTAGHTTIPQDTSIFVPYVSLFIPEKQHTQSSRGACTLIVLKVVLATVWSTSKLTQNENSCFPSADCGQGSKNMFTGGRCCLCPQNT